MNIMIFFCAFYFVKKSQKCLFTMFFYLLLLYIIKKLKKNISVLFFNYMTSASILVSLRCQYSFCKHFYIIYLVLFERFSSFGFVLFCLFSHFNFFLCLHIFY